MNTSIKLTVLAVCAAATSALASVSIGIGGGALFDSSGAPVTDGGLVYAVSSAAKLFPTGTSVETSLSVGDFTWQDNVLLGSWAVDSSVAGAGSFDAFLAGIALSGGVSQGAQIAIIWFPSLQSSAINDAASATFGTSYGVYTNPAWVIPADGSTVSFSVETAAIGGGISDALTRANQTVGFVPEPSSFAAFAGFAALGLAASRRRRA